MWKLKIIDEANQQWTGNGKRKTKEGERGTENVERGKGNSIVRTGNREL